MKTSEKQKEVSAKTTQNQKLKTISWSLPNPRRLRLRARKRPRECACGHVGGASAIDAASQKLPSRHPVLNLESENTNGNVLCQNVVREKKQQANDHAARECEREMPRKYTCCHVAGEPVRAIGAARWRLPSRHPVSILESENMNVNVLCQNAVREKKQKQTYTHAVREWESEHVPVSAGENDVRSVARHLGEKHEGANVFASASKSEHVSASDAANSTAVEDEKTCLEYHLTANERANSSLFVTATACVREK